MDSMSTANGSRRLSLCSIGNVNVNDDFLKVRDEYIASLSAPSLESPETSVSKMPALSTRPSICSFASLNEREVMEFKEDDFKLKRINLDIARTHLEVEQLESERMYYQQICHSIRDILERQRGEGHQRLVDSLLLILNTDPEP